MSLRHLTPLIEGSEAKSIICKALLHCLRAKMSDSTLQTASTSLDWALVAFGDEGATVPVSPTSLASSSISSRSDDLRTRAAAARATATAAAAAAAAAATAAAAAEAEALRALEHDLSQIMDEFAPLSGDIPNIDIADLYALNWTKIGQFLK